MGISHGSAMALPLQLYGKVLTLTPWGSSYSVPAHDSTQHDTFHPPWQSSWLFCCICMVTITSTLPVAPACGIDTSPMAQRWRCLYSCMEKFSRSRHGGS